MTFKKQTKPKIKVTKNGPYLVSGNVPITQQEISTDAQGTPTHYHELTKYPNTETSALCRCGKSRNKPFCDGTHQIVGFTGTETADNETYLDKPDVVEGTDLKLIDAKELCASARFCHKDGGIWNLVPKSDKKEAKVTACEEAANCPSGRLTVVDKKTGRVVEPTLEPSIYVLEDPDIGVSGPIWVRGGIPVESAEGKTYLVRNRVTLCRCGKSQNKPFCDSSHYPDE
jgi:CDGSH-type Zn-finger protein